MTRAWLVVVALGLATVADAQTVLRNPDGSQTGTSASPIRTDPTGATTQPVSGTVTANAGTNLNTSLLVLDATVTGRFPAGSNPANGESNSVNLSRLGAFNFIFNGSTWDRWTGAVTQSGTWTVQPGNTANTTAWLVTGTGGTFPATQSGTWTVQPGNTANTTPWLFQIRDAAGNARGANVTAGNALVVDGSAVTQPVSGTVTVQQGTGTNLHMVCDSGCSSSAGFADNSAFTFGTTAVNPIAGVLDDTATNAATENSAAVARITAQKALHINLRNNAGTEIGTAATPVQVSLANTAANATAVKVDGSAVTQPVSGTVTANAGTNLNTSLLQLDATGLALNVAQGAAIASKTGPLGQTSTTTAAPSYANATVNPLNTTTAGALRSDVSTIAGTAPTTAGKIDVKGADGDVFVRQATASNLNATVVGTGTFAVQATDNLTQVGSQTVLQGNQNNVASATGALTVGAIGRYDATQPTLTDTRFNLLQLSSRGSLFVTPGVEAFNVVCTSGCTPGGSFADASAFTFGTTAINTTGYVVDDTLTNYATENSAAAARMSPARVPYADLSKDTSGLVALIAQLTTLVTDLHNDGLHARNDREGYSLRGSFNQFIGSNGDALKVYPTTPQDPCAGASKVNVAISQTAATRLVVGQSGMRIYVCYARVVAGAAEIPSFVAGTGSACATGTSAVSGSTTAANGESYAANGGFSAGTGAGTVMATTKPGDDLCLAQSTSNRLAGNIVAVLAP